jgi:hypothetical protein
MSGPSGSSKLVRRATRAVTFDIGMLIVSGDPEDLRKLARGLRGVEIEAIA